MIIDGSSTGPAGSGLIEVRRWNGPATTGNLQRDINTYVNFARTDWNGVVLTPSPELNNWATSFSTGRDTAYVWGLGNPNGHVYFAPSADVPDDKAVEIIILQLLLSLAQILSPPRTTTPPAPKPPEEPQQPDPPEPPGSRVDGSVDGTVENPEFPEFPEVPEIPEVPVF